MIVLVIGGAGYIGSHTARALKRAGHEVIIFDNLSTGYESLASGFELIKGDILDAKALNSALRRVDGIMHFAAHAYVGESVTNPKKYFYNNVEGGLALLNAALEADVKKIIFSSTCAVYGETAKVPIAEDIPREPVNPYGVTKLFSSRRWRPTIAPTDFVLSACDISTRREPMRAVRSASCTIPRPT